MFAAMGAFAIVFYIIGLVAFVFWLWMLIDALMNEPTAAEKLLWFLVIFLLPLIGSIIYFVVRRNGRGGRTSLT